MKRGIKYLISASFVATCAIAATSLASCKGNKGYNVTFHAMEGHTINGVQDYTYKNCTNIDYEYSPDPKADYDFVGWYDNDKCTGEIQTFPKRVTCDLNFYAKYNTVEGVNIVNFVTDGTKVPTYQVNKTESIKTEPVTTKDEYDFTGWLDKNGNKVVFPYTPTQNETLTASWKHIDKYHLILHTNGGSQPQNTEEYGEDVDVYITKDVSKIIDIAPSTTKSDYSLKEWQDKDGNKVNFPLTLAGETDLYAAWKANTNLHTAYFHDGDIDIGTITECSYIAYEPKPSQFGYSKSGYDFKGWYKDSSLTEPAIDFAEGVTLEGDTDFYAKFEKSTTAKVTLIDIDKTKEIGSFIYNLGETIYAPFDYTGSMSGYCKLIGWYKDNEYKEELEYPYTFTSSDADLKLYAKTERTSANVVIINPEDNFAVATLGNVETIVTKPDVTISGRKEDYICTALCTDSSCSEESEIKEDEYPYVINDDKESFISSNTLTLYAKWNRKYRITLIYGAGHTPESTVMEHQLSSITPSELTKITCADQKIMKWTDSKGNEYDPSDDKNPINLTADETFTADWTYTHRSITVQDFDGNKYTYNHMPVSLNLSDIPVKNPKQYYTLTGYYFNGTKCLFSEVTQVTLKDDVSEFNFVEIWERSSCKLTIKYNKDDIPDAVIENQPLTFHPADLPLVTVQDNKLIGFSYNGKTYYLDGEENITVNSDEATVTAVYSQTAFTVTFDYNDGDTSTKHVVEHCSRLTSSNIPNPTRTGYRFLGWTKDKESTTYISLEDTDVTADAYYYAQWESTESTFTVTFNVGYLQAAACFTDGTREKVYADQQQGLSFDDCPKCTCFGNVFLGWFTSDTGGEEVSYPLSKTQTVYAHWAPEEGYKTLTLTLENGTFEDTGTTTTLLTVKKDTTQWGDAKVKGSIPTIIFDDAFKVDNWTTTKGDISTAVATDTTFSDDTTLYSYLEDDVKTPSNFNTDNWPTVCAVAENKDGTYSNGLVALQTVYGITNFVEQTRTVKFDGTEYTVRVVGQGQDYGDENRTTHLPLTFEFVKSVYTDKINSETIYRWSDSTLRTKLNEGGSTYELMQSSLIYNNHISTVYKATGERVSTSVTTAESVMSASKLFVPSVFELNITDSGINKTNQFTYTYYASATAATRIKEFGELGAANYFCRDYYYYTDSQGAKDPCIAYIRHDGSLHRSQPYNGRPIAPMFCIGKAY